MFSAKTYDTVDRTVLQTVLHLGLIGELMAA